MSWRAKIWRLNSALAIITSIVCALNGNARCFLWLFVAWLDWQLANYIVKKEGELNDKL